MDVGGVGKGAARTMESEGQSWWGEWEKEVVAREEGGVKKEGGAGKGVG